MARRHRSGPLERLLIRLVVGAIGVALLWGAADEGEWSTFFLMLFALVLAFWFWFLFLMRTSCDVQNAGNGKPCSKLAYGLLRACDIPRHKQIKRRAIAARVGLHAWANRARNLWADHSREPAAEPVRTGPHEIQPAGDNGNLCRSGYEAISLTCTVTSTVIGVIGFVLTLIGGTQA